MLRALLSDKLGRLVEEDGEIVTDAGAAFPRLEDPLTAAVFSRMRYLPTEEWWALLGAAVEAGDPWPDPPSGRGEWRFWPSLAPGSGGGNTTRVEPDVLVVFDDLVLLIEVKHRMRQSGGQWREQALAVAASRFLRPRAVLLAVGGLDAASFATERAVLLGAHAPLTAHLAGWGSLRDALLRGAEGRWESRLVRQDMHDAIVHWGYRPSLSLRSLVAAHRAVMAGGTLRKALPRQHERSAGLRDLVERARQNHPRAAASLPRWSRNV